jgi:hypothetical protein
MSDILFIHPTDSTEYNLGIAIISAVVKEKGFTSELFMLDFRRPVEMLDTELVAKIQTEQPLLIAISVMSTYWKTLRFMVTSSKRTFSSSNSGRWLASDIGAGRNSRTSLCRLYLSR